MTFNERKRVLYGFINYNFLDWVIHLAYIFMIGENTFLKLRLRVANYEHQVDDLKAYIKQLERKLKKYEDNNIRTTRNGKDNDITKLSRRIYQTRSAS